MFDFIFGTRKCDGDGDGDGGWIKCRLSLVNWLRCLLGYNFNSPLYIVFFLSFYMGDVLLELLVYFSMICWLLSQEIKLKIYYNCCNFHLDHISSIIYEDILYADGITVLCVFVFFEQTLNVRVKMSLSLERHHF